MNILLDDLTNPVVHLLLQEHMDDMVATSPPESRHALDLSGLQQPDISFWCAWDGEHIMGCGALKELGDLVGEIKSMRTARGYLRQGVAKTLLEHIIGVANKRRYKKLCLETGSMAFFEPARKMYERAGFQYCGPFGDYVLDPNSVFMELGLDG